MARRMSSHVPLPMGVSMVGVLSISELPSPMPPLPVPLPPPGAFIIIPSARVMSSSARVGGVVRVRFHVLMSRMAVGVPVCGVAGSCVAATWLLA